jgi:hypothetical protein
MRQLTSRVGACLLALLVLAGMPGDGRADFIITDLERLEAEPARRLGSARAAWSSALRKPRSAIATPSSTREA